MKHLMHYTSLLLILFFITSCSSDTEGLLKKLYATTPAEAEIVVDINIEKLLKDSGAKVSKEGVKDASRFIDLISEGNKALKDNLDWILSPESAVSPEAAVIFTHSGRTVTSFFLTDPEKFRTNLAAKSHAEWENTSVGKQTLSLLHLPDGNTIAVADDQAFAGRGITGDYIASLLTLSEVESFNGVDYAEKMAKSDEAVNFWGSIDGLLRDSQLGFAAKAQVKMMLGMFFNNPKYIVGSVTNNKESVTLTTYILDNNLKPSKCELAISKIDTDRIAALDGNANFVTALAVSGDLIKQINNVASSAGGALPKQFSELIAPLDGTIAFASPALISAKSDGGITDNYRLCVPTNGKQNAALSQFLQSFGTLTIDGNLLNIAKGSYGDGSLPLESVAKEFKDAWFGMAFTVENKDLPHLSSGIITAGAHDGTMALKVKLNLF